LSLETDDPLKLASEIFNYGVFIIVLATPEQSHVYHCLIITIDIKKKRCKSICGEGILKNNLRLLQLLTQRENQHY